MLALLFDVICMITLAKPEESSPAGYQCNYVDNAYLRSCNPYGCEGTEYAFPLPIDVCTATYVLPIRIYNNSINQEQEQIEQENSNSQFESSSDEQQTLPLLKTTTHTLQSLLNPFDTFIRENNMYDASDYDELLLLSDDNYYYGNISSWKMTCSKSNDLIYYEAFLNSSDCDSEKLAQTLIVNNTGYKCDASKHCDYVAFTTYPTYQSETDCQHKQWFTTSPIVKNHCMAIDLTFHESPWYNNQSSLAKCDNKTQILYGTEWNETTVCNSNYVQSWNISDGCNYFPNPYIGTEQLFAEIECDNKH